MTKGPVSPPKPKQAYKPFPERDAPLLPELMEIQPDVALKTVYSDLTGGDGLTTMDAYF